MEVLANGPGFQDDLLLIAGGFLSVGGQSHNGIFAFDGESILQYDQGLPSGCVVVDVNTRNNRVLALVTAPFVGVYERLGNTWSFLGSPPQSGPTCIEQFNGQIYVGGYGLYRSPTGNVWNDALSGQGVLISDYITDMEVLGSNLYFGVVGQITGSTFTSCVVPSVCTCFVGGTRTTTHSCARVSTSGVATSLGCSGFTKGCGSIKAISQHQVVFNFTANPGTVNSGGSYVPSAGVSIWDATLGAWVSAAGGVGNALDDCSNPPPGGGCIQDGVLPIEGSNRAGQIARTDDGQFVISCFDLARAVTSIGGSEFNGHAQFLGNAFAPIGYCIGERPPYPQGYAASPGGPIAIFKGELYSSGVFIGPNGNCSIAKFRKADIDFNNDGVSPDSSDIDDFLNVLGGGECSEGNFCDSLDFNSDCVFPILDDFEAFVAVSGGDDC